MQRSVEGIIIKYDDTVLKVIKLRWPMIHLELVSINQMVTYSAGELKFKQEQHKVNQYSISIVNLTLNHFRFLFL